MVHWQKFLSRGLLLGALTFVLFATACNLPSAQTPTPVGTILPTGQVIVSPSPSQTLNNTSPTALIPVTGMDVVTQQCQFCVNDEVHAVLLMPEQASFLVPDPLIRVNCVTVKVVNGERIVFCRGAQQTSFNLNVCLNNTDCFQYPITLVDCSAIPQNGVMLTPVVLTPVNNVSPPTAASPVSTATAVVLPTQTVISAPASPTPTIPPPPAAPTSTVAVIVPSIVPTGVLHQQPTKAPPIIRQPTASSAASQSPATVTGLQDPGTFVRWYFGQVWQTRNYQNLWDNYLTPAFKAHASPGGFPEYAGWWSSVQRVDVNSVDVLQNDGTHAWVRANVTFTLQDGRVIGNQQYDYDLFFDAARQTWMFDYRAP
jgi:hypothetical protein